MARKDFRKHNKGFICKNCDTKNPKAAKSERNHCFACLYSLHVDEETPGDRKSRCRGLMKPVNIDYRGSKGFMILHRCVRCRKEMRNRAAVEDEIKLF